MLRDRRRRADPCGDGNGAVTGAPPPLIRAPGIGEAPPTAGLPPRWADVLWPGRGPTLEQALCHRFGFSDIEITSTGTAALLIAFATLKQLHPRRDVVIVPGYTCPLVVIAAAAAGVRVVACDTSAGGLDFDLDHLRGLVGNGVRPSGSDTRVDVAHVLAIVPTHFGGWLADVDAVRAAAPGIPIVEDAAQALGGTWRGQSTGLGGDIGVFSLGAGKGLTIYEGGALVARDPAMLSAMRRTAARLQQGSALGALGRAAMLLGYHAAYTPLGLRLAYGRPKRRALDQGDEIEAAGDRFAHDVPVTPVGQWRKRVGRAALVRLDAHLAESRTRFNRLATRLSGIPGLVVHVPPDHSRPSATALFVTLPPHPERDALIRALWRTRLGVARMFSHAITDYPDIAPLMLPSETPHARALAAGTITITTSTLLSPDAETTIVATLEGFARDAGWK